MLEKKKLVCLLAFAASSTLAGCATLLPNEQMCILDPPNGDAICWTETGDVKNPLASSTVKISDMRGWISQTPSMYESVINYCGVQKLK